MDNYHNNTNYDRKKNITMKDFIVKVIACSADGKNELKLQGYQLA